MAAVAWIGHDEPRSLGERESGGGLALPMWIDVMARALRGVPLQPLPATEGVVHVGDDWRFAEFEAGGHVVTLGEAHTAPVAASAATPASAPTSAPAR